MIIFPIILFFINTSTFPQTESYFRLNNTSDSLSIFLIKERWHTGIIFNKETIDTTILPGIKDFPDVKFLDIGWGDREFYLHPGFDYELAFKALFYPTPSVLRIQGIYSINNYINSSDVAMEIKISKSSFKKLCRYIHETFFKNETGTRVIITERNNGSIKYYEANGNYSILNTCNTWIAKGLRQAGLDVSDNIIITDQIFREIQNHGRIIKAPDD